VIVGLPAARGHHVDICGFPEKAAGPVRSNDHRVSALAEQAPKAGVGGAASARWRWSADPGVGAQFGQREGVAGSGMVSR